MNWRMVCAAGVMSFLLAACQSGPEVKPAADPHLSAQDLEVAEQGLTDFRLRLNGKVQGTAEATLTKASYELVVDGKVVHRGEQAIDKTVGPTGEAAFSVEQSSRYVSGPEELIAMNERGGSLLSALRGTLFVRQGGKEFAVPYARSREIRVPRLPGVKLHELDAARYSDRESNATFYLGVVNPNPFPVKLGGLGYRITVGGKQLAEGVRGAGEKISTAATGVFEIQVPINQETYGPEVGKLIKTLTLPYEIRGEVEGELFKVPYELTGEIKLRVSR